MEVIEHNPSAPPRVPAAHGGAFAFVERWLDRPGTAWAILIGSLVLTGAAWWASHLFALDDARQRFERRTDDVQRRIEGRLVSYEAVLRGGVALFAADPNTSRDAWKHYAATIAAERTYPGIQGFGVARLIQPGELAEHVAAVRREGFPQYGVRPSGARDIYSSIVYLEPFDARNQRAFGFDMLSEPTRRAAMERARDTGEPAMSGIVTLVQDNGQDVRKGFLIYLPIYRDAAAGSLTVRPDKLWGWVYAPFGVRDLMTGILGSDVDTIGFRIHDGPAGASHDAFYASDRDAGADSRTPEFRRSRAFAYAGREWTIDFEGHGLAAADTGLSNLVAVCGLSFDLLLFWSIASLARRKAQFEHVAEKRSDESLARQASLTAVAGLSPDAVLVFERGEDGVHRLVFNNPVFSRWFGLSPEDLLGLSETAVDEWLAGLVHAGESMPPLTDGDACTTIAGPPLRVLQRGMREGPRQRVYYFRDITHESEVDRLKNEFLSTAAHELRTPLASVYGFAELLQDGRIDPSRRQRAASIVYRQAGVLKHLVDELLDLARIDSRRGKDFVIERIDLRQVAEAAAESVLVPGTMPRVQLALGLLPVWVDADRAKMTQALVNVLGNALKYSPPESSVSLSLEALSRDGQKLAALRVVDCGIGMSPEECDRAFERFYRADPSGHILGAGLGLSIVREIVELHQGRVELHSTPGAGTQVTLWLPLAHAEREAVERIEAAFV